ncbi:MAG: hypothetical protein ACOC2W_03660 [bacterium]
MEIIYLIPLLIYVSINSFIVGYTYADDYKYTNTNSGKLLSITWMVLSFLFGALIYGIIITYALINRIFRFFNEYFQIKFFITFYFTKKWDNLEESKVEQITNFANKKDKSKLNNRIYIYCVNLLKKRLEKNKLKNK